MSEEENKKLLNEIDSLEDDSDGKKTSKGKFQIKFAYLMLFILVLIVIILYAKNEWVELYSEEDYDYDEYEELTEEEKELYLDDFYETFGNDSEDIEKISEEEILETKFKTIKENIVVEQVGLNYNKDLILKVTNNNDITLSDINIDLIFYDGENKPIKIDSGEISVFPLKSDYYITFEETPKNFERYEILISPMSVYEYKVRNKYNDLKEYIEISTKDNKDGVEIKIKNNYDKDVDVVYFQILYYKENNVINAETYGMWDLKKNKSEKEIIYTNLYDENTYEDIEYDKYEIVYGGAYIY